jgi:hypothetical protein
MKQISYSRHRFPDSIIQHAVWLYFRFPLSFRDVEDMLAERGIDVSYESVRRWSVKFGLDKTLIVLSADHGAPEAPGYLKKLGFESDYVAPKTWDKAGAIGKLKKRFGIGKELITTYFHPYIYLNRKFIAEKGLNQAEVEHAVAEELTRFDGVALALPSSALASGRLPDMPLITSVLRNYNPRRSGDIYLVFEPNRFINDFDGLTVAATHGSPWRYDTFVPIMFAGKEFLPGTLAARLRRKILHLRSRC